MGPDIKDAYYLEESSPANGIHKISASPKYLIYIEKILYYLILKLKQAKPIAGRVCFGIAETI